MRDSSLPSATRLELTLESLVDLMNLCYTGLPRENVKLCGRIMQNVEEGRCFFLGGRGRFFDVDDMGGNLA